jgi:hypothetical protein
LTPLAAAPAGAEEGFWALEWSVNRTYDVVLQGSIAYVGSEDEFLVVDVTDPASPEQIGSLGLFDADLNAIAASGSLVVAADHAADALLIIDVADRTSPQIMSRMDDMHGVYDVRIAGDIALIADVDGLSLVDISDPTDPHRIKGPMMSRAHHIEIADGTAYLSGFINGLQAVDFSQPSEPIAITGSDPIRFYGAAGMDVVDELAYLVYRNGLMILDVSDPQSPAEIGFVGNLTAEPGVSGSVEVSGGIACVLGENGVSFVDVSNPSAPAEVGFAAMSIEHTFYLGLWGTGLRLIYSLGAGLAVSGTTAIVAGVTDGLVTVDFSDPSKPFEIGRLRDSLGRGCDAAVVGNRAYVGTTSDFLTVSLVNRKTPSIMGSLDLPSAVRDVKVSNGYALVTVDWIGLLIIDVRDPTKPRVAAELPAAREEMSVAVDGPLACLVDGSRALVIDISEPESPELQAVVDVPAYEAELLGNTLVVMTREFDHEGHEYSSLRVFDLSDVHRPAPLGTLDFGYRARLGLFGARVHVADGRGLHAIDVTDPALPVELSRSKCGDRSGAPIAVSNTLVCQAEWLEILWIRMLWFNPDRVTHCFDVTDPLTPRPTGRAYQGVVRAVSDGLLYGTTDSSFWVVDPNHLKTRWLSGVAVDPGHTTHLVLLNRWPVENEVEVGLATPHGAVAGTAVLPPGRQLVVEVDGVSGREQSGMIRVQPTLPILANAQVESSTRPVGTMRIARALPEWHKCGRGWFGVDSGRLAEGWDSGIGWIVGLRHLENRFATDLVLSDPDDESDPDLVAPFPDDGPAKREVEITLYATDGTELSTYRLEVAGGSTVVDPEPFAQRAGRPNLGWGYARINGRVLASALVRDLRTGDAVTVPMVKDPSIRHGDGELRPQWLEFAARNRGFLESCWRTDLVVLNLSEQTAHVELTLHAPGAEFSTEIAVAGSEQAIFRDVVGLLGPSCKGMLEVQSDTPVVVSGRIYNQSEAGTAGHAIRGRDVYSGLLTGETAWLVGLRQVEGRYRTNINVSNLGGEPADVRITLFDSTGIQLDEFRLQVPPMRVVQDIEPFAERCGHPDLGWGYARVTAEKGRGVFVSASVVNNLTNDSVTIEMQR